MTSISTLRDLPSLVRAGLIADPRSSAAAAANHDALQQVAARYAIAITPAIAAAIVPGDPDDPVARQFVPAPEELITTADELADPIGDGAHTPIAGIVHRYPDRVLLKPLHACAVYCRFCFRREMVGPGAEALGEAELDAGLEYIRRRPEIFEVILTGGDPLLLSPRRLGAIVEALDRIPHVGSIRIHTRIPVVDPERIDAALLAALDVPTAVWIAVHANHANELTDACRAALQRLTGAGIPLVSQTVLLAGVNDDPAVLEALFRALVANRVKPYYLHHPDLAPGTARFRLSLDRGRALVKQLRGRLSGLAQPTYVLDLPGGHGKVPVGPEFSRPDGSIEDPFGGVHAYPPVAPDPEP